MLQYNCMCSLFLKDPLWCSRPKHMSSFLQMVSIFFRYQLLSCSFYQGSYSSLTSSINFTWILAQWTKTYALIGVINKGKWKLLEPAATFNHKYFCFIEWQTHSTLCSTLPTLCRTITDSGFESSILHTWIYSPCTVWNSALQLHTL